MDLFSNPVISNTGINSETNPFTSAGSEVAVENIWSPVKEQDQPLVSNPFNVPSQSVSDPFSPSSTATDNLLSVRSSNPFEWLDKNHPITPEVFTPTLGNQYQPPVLSNPFIPPLSLGNTSQKPMIVTTQNPGTSLPETTFHTDNIPSKGRMKPQQQKLSLSVAPSMKKEDEQGELEIPTTDREKKSKSKKNSQEDKESLEEQGKPKMSARARRMDTNDKDETSHRGRRKNMNSRKKSETNTPRGDDASSDN
jgi:hypothetical protein